MPYDFMHVTPCELTDTFLIGRLSFLPVFGKYEKEDREDLAPPSPPLSREEKESLHIKESSRDLKMRLVALREITIRMGDTGINAFFEKRVEESFPDFTFDGKQRVKTIKDVLKAYRRGLTDDAMLIWVFGTVWGTGNDWATDLEHELMEFFCLRYNGDYANNVIKAREAKGGNIRAVLVKKKQGMLETIKKAVFKKEGKSFFQRLRKFEEGEVNVLQQRPRKLMRLDPLPDGGYVGVFHMAATTPVAAISTVRDSSSLSTISASTLTLNSSSTSTSASTLGNAVRMLKNGGTTQQALAILEQLQRVCEHVYVLS